MWNFESVQTSNSKFWINPEPSKTIDILDHNFGNNLFVFIFHTTVECVKDFNFDSGCGGLISGNDRAVLKCVAHIKSGQKWPVNNHLISCTKAQSKSLKHSVSCSNESHNLYNHPFDLSTVSWQALRWKKTRFKETPRCKIGSH